MKTRRLREEVSYMVADLTQTKRGKAKAREIRRRESLARTARTRPYITSLTDALLRIRSFDANGKKRQARHSYYIRRRSQTRRAEKTPLIMTTSRAMKTVVNSARKTRITFAHT
jgi:hypothetical protein